ncbi:MAG: tetratricopeptide repeat protein [Candidatus Kapabacteria bacterium]|nr:tetratricopeptide repeat protein [Candidatus Kapabacteria bacterium]
MWAQLADRGLLGETPQDRLQRLLHQESRGLTWQAEQWVSNGEMLPVNVREWARFLAVRDLVRQGLWRQGLHEIRTFLLREPLSPLRFYFWQWAGIAAFQLRDYAEAERCWDSTLGLLQTVADTSLRLTIQQEVSYWRLLALLQQARYQRADSAAASFVERYPTSAHADEALFFRALLSELQSNYRLAAQQLQQLQQLYPCHTATPHALAREAYVRLILQEFTKALRLLEALHTLLERLRTGGLLQNHCEPVDSVGLPWQELLFVRAEAYLQRAQWEAAEQGFEELVRLFPQGHLRDRAYLQLGWLRLHAGQADEALEYFRALQQSVDRQVAALAALYVGLALKARGDTAAARQAFLELSLQPDFPYSAKVLLELGQLGYEAAQYRNARLNLEQALREAREAATMARVLILLGATYQRLEQWDHALRTFRAAEQLLQQGDTLLVPRWRRYWEQALLGAATSLLLLQRSAEALRLLEQLSGAGLQQLLQPDEVLFWLAEAYYRTGDFTQATYTYEQLLLRYPNSPRREEALYGTAWCAFRTQQMDRAAFWFDRLLTEFPQTRYGAEALVRKADALYLLRQYQKAATAYWELIQRFPKTSEGEYAAYQYGYVLYRLRDYTAAEQAFRYFARTYPQSSLADEALYFWGWLAFQRQQYGESVERFRNLLDLYPRSPLAARTWFAIGNAYYNMEQWQDALEAYRSVVERYPHSPYAVEAVKSVQYCLWVLGRSEEAYRWADTIALRYPATRLEEEARFKRAELLFSQQRYDAALREYGEFAQRYPYSERTPEALYWAFRSALALGDLETARRLSRQLRQHHAQQWYSVQSLLELAREEAHSNPATADSLYRQVERLGDSTQASEASFNRGVLAYVQGDTLAAVARWQKLLENFPTTEFAAQARYQLAMYWRAREAYDSVRYYLMPLAARRDVVGAEGLYYIGEAWMREGRCDSAIVAFQQLQAIHPGTENWYSLSLLQMGECYERMNNHAAASEVYQLVLTLRPTDEYGRTARSRLNRLPRGRP